MTDPALCRVVQQLALRLAKELLDARVIAPLIGRTTCEAIQHVLGEKK